MVGLDRRALVLAAMICDLAAIGTGLLDRSVTTAVVAAAVTAAGLGLALSGLRNPVRA